MLNLTLIIACLVLIRSQETEQERERKLNYAHGRYDSVDDLPEFHKMLTEKIGKMLPTEMQPYHKYYSHFFYPYVPYSEAQLEYILEGNQVEPATPPHYAWLQEAYNNNNNNMNG